MPLVCWMVWLCLAGWGWMSHGQISTQGQARPLEALPRDHNREGVRAEFVCPGAGLGRWRVGTGRSLISSFSISIHTSLFSNGNINVGDYCIMKLAVPNTPG